MLIIPLVSFSVLSWFILLRSTLNWSDKRPFLVARQQNNLWLPEMVSSITLSTRQLPFIHTEKGHQQHHHHDVLHVLPLVHVEQDAEDDDLDELPGRDKRILVVRIPFPPTLYGKCKLDHFCRPFYLCHKVVHAGCEQRALIETNDHGRKKKKKNEMNCESVMRRAGGCPCESDSAVQGPLI